MTVYVQHINTLTSEAALPSLYDAVQNEYLPLMDALDVRLLGYWATSSLQGRSGETVAVWEFDDYQHVERYVRAQYDGSRDGRSLRTWATTQAEWVTRTEGLICLPGESSPTVAELRSAQTRPAMVVHETVLCHPYRNAEYPRRLHEMWSNRFNENTEQPKERQELALLYAKWSNTIAINIWGIGKDWDSVVVWREEWERDPGFDLWNTLGREIRSDFFDRFMVPAPFSTV